MTSVLYINVPPRDVSQEAIQKAIETDTNLKLLRHSISNAGLDGVAARDATAKTLAACANKVFSHIRTVLEEYPKLPSGVKTTPLEIKTSNPQVVIRWHLFPEKVLALYPSSNVPATESLPPQEADVITKLSALVFGTLFTASASSRNLVLNSQDKLQEFPLEKVGLSLLQVSGGIPEDSKLLNALSSRPIFRAVVWEAYQEYKIISEQRKAKKQACAIQ